MRKIKNTMKWKKNTKKLRISKKKQNTTKTKLRKKLWKKKITHLNFSKIFYFSIQKTYTRQHLQTYKHVPNKIVHTHAYKHTKAYAHTHIHRIWLMKHNESVHFCTKIMYIFIYLFQHTHKNTHTHEHTHIHKRDINIHRHT